MTKVIKKVSHFREHRRVQEHGAIVNVASGELTVPPSLTKQEFKRECDINNIIKHFSTTGMFTHINAKAAQGTYQDLPDSVDFQESLHTVRAAEAAFMTLPAKVRDRFGQDPAEFLSFMANPENLEEIRKLGLAQAVPDQPPPTRVEIVNPPLPQDKKE